MALCARQTPTTAVFSTGGKQVTRAARAAARPGRATPGCRQGAVAACGCADSGAGRTAKERTPGGRRNDERKRERERSATAPKTRFFRQAGPGAAIVTRGKHGRHGTRLTSTRRSRSYLREKRRGTRWENVGKWRRRQKGTRKLFSLFLFLAPLRAMRPCPPPPPPGRRCCGSVLRPMAPPGACEGRRAAAGGGGPDAAHCVVFRFTGEASLPSHMFSRPFFLAPARLLHASCAHTVSVSPQSAGSGAAHARPSSRVTAAATPNRPAECAADCDAGLASTLPPCPLSAPCPATRAIPHAQVRRAPADAARARDRSGGAGAPCGHTGMQFRRCWV